MDNINGVEDFKFYLLGSVESTDIPSPLLQTIFQSNDNRQLGQNGIAWCISSCLQYKYTLFDHIYNYNSAN